MNITFKKKQATEKSLTYVDVDLMLENKAIVNVELNKKNEKDDLNVLTDMNSVKNRLKTLFSTKRAQKHLDFNYGCDLSQFLFEPNTDVLRNNIGDEILNQIKRYEPGITVTHVDVKPNQDSGEMFIKVDFSFNKLQSYINFSVSEYSITFI